MSRILQWPTHDPDEDLDYSIDWSARLGTDTIITSTWSYTGSPDTTPLLLQNGAINSDADITTIWINDGTSGTTYSITNNVVTTAGRTMEQTVSIKVRSR